MSDKAMVYSGLSASIPVEGGSTISDRLAAYGISHEAGKDGCRYLTWQGKSICTSDALQAIALLGLLDAVAGSGSIPAGDFDRMIRDCENPSPAPIALRERLQRVRLRAASKEKAA